MKKCLLAAVVIMTSTSAMAANCGTSITYEQFITVIDKATPDEKQKYVVQGFKEQWNEKWFSMLRGALEFHDKGDTQAVERLKRFMRASGCVVRTPNNPKHDRDSIYMDL